MRQTTKGWKLLVRWKNGETNWLSLKDLKESEPVRTAEHAVANKLTYEPAFAWWVNHTLKRRDRIICKVQKRHLKCTHEFGIRMKLGEILFSDKIEESAH